MDRRFSGKNVLVTGSSRGIGFAVAKEFGLLGANVALNCNVSVTEMDSAVLELKSLGASVFGIQGDVSSYSDCIRLFKTFEENFGCLDILVNNAGISQYGLFTDSSPSEWERSTSVNLFSAYNCCHIVLPKMISRKEGRIINISSVWGVSGASCEVLYSASKGALNTFTKALAKELAPSGVFVNAIACGVIDTTMNGRLSDVEKEALKDSIGLMKFGAPEDVAKLCVYLAETEYMVGQVLTLDGGFLD